jgi:bacteriorhodopsin
MMSLQQGQRSRALTLAGLLLAFVPFVFGILRFAETRSDTRYLWTALASLVGAVVVASPRAWAQRPLVAHMLVAFLAAVMCAALSAYLQHVTFGPGMVIVSGAFGLFSGTGAALLWRKPAG